jgi:chloramphenicol-sensitive protein RarD
MNHNDFRRGIALSVGASAMFALLSAYATLLKPLSGLDIFAWRIVWTVPGALLLVAVRKRLPILRALVVQMMTRPKLRAAMIVAAGLLGVQLWLFLWAPLHGRMLEVSLGYFLLPLTMVLVGRFYYRERLDPLQWLAVAFAALGVGHELWATRAFSWPTLVVALGYPPYFIVRRKINADSLATFAMEMLLLLPVAVLCVATSARATAVLSRIDMWGVLLPGLGVLSTVALACYLSASRLLPMALFGILGYVEPVLLVVVAVAVLGETLSAGQYATYVPIWVAVALTGLHSVLLLRAEMRREQLPKLRV